MTTFKEKIVEILYKNAKILPINGKHFTHVDREQFTAIASEISKLIPSEDWISVSERIPQSREVVLCYNGYIVISNSWEIGLNQDEAWFRKVFTHWKPMIQLPAQNS